MAIPTKLEGVRQEMCTKYQESTDVIYQQLRTINTRIRGPINKLRQLLEKLKSEITTPIDELTDAIRDFGDQFDNIIPDFSDLEELDKLIAACTPFGKLFNGLGNLQDAIDAIVDVTINLSADLLDEAADTIMKNTQEYISAKAINALDKLFEKFKINKIIIELDEFLQCINGLCPDNNTQAIIDKINNLQNDMYFTDSGKFDSARLIRDVGLSADKAYNVNRLKASIESFGNNAINEASKRVGNIYDQVNKVKKNPFVGKISEYF